MELVGILTMDIIHSYQVPQSSSSDPGEDHLRLSHRSGWPDPLVDAWRRGSWLWGYGKDGNVVGTNKGIWVSLKMGSAPKIFPLNLG